MWSTVAHKGHLDIFDRKLVTRDRDLEAAIAT